MKIGLIGVTGFTGSLVAKLLIEKGIDFVPAGRNKQLFKQLYGDKLGKLFYVDLTQKQTLEDFVAKVDLVINCVGPFNLLAPNLLDVILSAGNKTYFDITGEQQIVLDSFTNRAKQAKEQNVTIIHSVAYESFLADLLAETFLEENQVYDRIDTLYYSEKHMLSNGSRFTMRLRPFYKTYKIKNGKLIEAQPFEEINNLLPHFAPPEHKYFFVPLPEIIMFYFRFNTLNSGSFHLLDEYEATTFMGKSNKQDIQTIIAKETKRKRRFVSEEYRQKEVFYLILSAQRQGETYSYLVKNVDTYGLTAKLAVAFLETIYYSKLQGGVFTPAELVESQKFMDAVEICPETINLT